MLLTIESPQFEFPEVAAVAGCALLQESSKFLTFCKTNPDGTGSASSEEMEQNRGENIKCSAQN